MRDDADLRGYVMMDARGRTVGNVLSYWTDPATGRVHFAAVKTGLLRGGLHLVPLRDARLDEARRILHVPYERARIVEAPTHAPGAPLEREEADAALAHYRAAPPETALGSPPALGEVVLHEEKVRVGKRLVGGGGLRLRKVVRRETIHVPVEVLREEIVVERVGADEMPPKPEMGALPEEPFREGAMYIPTWREEPVVSKTAEVAGAVRASRVVETEREMVRAEVRKEDVEVERERFPRAGEPDGRDADRP